MRIFRGSDFTFRSKNWIESVSNNNRSAFKHKEMNCCCEFTVWTSITDENVATCDSDFFNKFGGVSAYSRKINDKFPDAELTFSCHPEPYSGNPNSNVYCLNKMENN